MKHIETLLSEMTIEQKAPIVKILGLKNNDNNLIIEKLSKILLPVGGFLQTPLNYKQIIEKIASDNNQNIDLSLGIIDAEKKLYVKLFHQEFEKLTEKEKDNIYNELEKAGLDRSQIKSLSSISALGAAQLSGFGVYLLASSTLGAITSVLGVTLPFAFYTGMSSAISFVIGPVGFLVMGVLVYRSFKNVKSWDEAFDLLKASWKGIKAFAIGDSTRSTLAFKYLAATRIVLTENLLNEIEANSSKIKIRKTNILKINSEIDNHERKIVNIKNAKNSQSNLASTIKIEILKKQEKLKNVSDKIYLLDKEIGNVAKNIQDKIYDKKLNEKEVLISEYESKLKLSKIDKLNN
ncbi:hypothetical protein [Cellulophaga sp. Z1A5H]|uniref:hypothetical protein n=1 Tax=Cellulophaga sp. Z1A5H TaxID=2687291 RepID=UPI0013FDC113|nr:hypothetical protein [Cellulophaga sp. Z1A5H]